VCVAGLRQRSEDELTPVVTGSRSGRKAFWEGTKRDGECRWCQERLACQRLDSSARRLEERAWTAYDVGAMGFEVEPVVWRKWADGCARIWQLRRVSCSVLVMGWLTFQFPWAATLASYSLSKPDTGRGASLSNAQSSSTLGEEAMGKAIMDDTLFLPSAASICPPRQLDSSLPSPRLPRPSPQMMGNKCTATSRNWMEAAHLIIVQ
jgi:hypothetical protein